MIGTRQYPLDGRQITRTFTVEVAAAASANTQYRLGRIPTTAAIIGGLSKIYWDDLASTGSPTIDVGLKAVNANVTTDVDALNDGLDVATAAGSASLIKDIANYGKQAWEFVAGVTADPGGELDLIVTILDAATNTGGTVTVELTIQTDL
ncbi:hypothetical protein CNY89_00025 [Amaricoccus sp. HAR-UPW-R2A-40]|nr:hypothetical protein CNY89_00025 [Amaricoccus sp. HAR-UPW-R2A-40]